MDKIKDFDLHKSEPFPSSFVTGSYAYGNPTSESDIDVVVLISKSDIELLKKLADSYINNDRKYGAGNDSLRFGKLNLICLAQEDTFEKWKEVTEELASHDKCYTKEESAAVFHERLDVE